MLLASAALTAAAGCATPAASSSYRVTIPTLHAAPVRVSCLVDGAKKFCSIVVEDDWAALIRELKAACLALGGTREECQAE